MKKKYTQEYLQGCITTDYLNGEDYNLENLTKKKTELDLLVDNRLAVVTEPCEHGNYAWFDGFYTMCKFMCKLNPQIKKMCYDASKYGIEERKQTVDIDDRIAKLSKYALFPGIYYAAIGEIGSENYAVLLIMRDMVNYDGGSYTTTRSSLYFIGPKRLRMMAKYMAYYKKMRKLYYDDGMISLYDKTSSEHCTTLPVKGFDRIVFKGKDKLIKYIDHFVESIPKYYEHGVTPKLSILMYGGVGVGKSTIATAIAKYLELDVVQYLTPDHLIQIPGKRDRLKHYNNAMYILDDIDCMCISREDDSSVENKMMIQQLLAFLDAPKTFIFKAKDGIYYPISIVVATTNYYDKLDPAVKRHGRFDYSFEMSDFDIEDAKEMCKMYNTTLEEVLEKAGKHDHINPAQLQALCMEHIDSSLKDK